MHDSFLAAPKDDVRGSLRLTCQQRVVSGIEALRLSLLLISDAPSKNTKRKYEELSSDSSPVVL